MNLEDLDFLYTPSRDVARDIEDGGIRVAMLQLTDHPPRILLTDHVEGDRPILVYRVADHAGASAELRARGWTPERSLEIPQGPVSSYRSPGVLAHFEGRRDF